jgi:predicted nucleotidyltransferase component of viral defense system
MLTRAQIQQYAHRNGIGMQAQERDYIQTLLLYLLFRGTQELVFKGGTALRMVYHGNRYSEDLDFNGRDDPVWINGVWQIVITRLIDFGVFAQLRNEWISDVGVSFDVSYQGPLFDGRNRTKGKVRVDVNRRQEAVGTQRELVVPVYDDIRPFVVNVITPEQLLAEKIRALLMRSKPRDAYDIFLMLKQGVRLDFELVEAKLMPFEIVLSQENLEAALKKCQEEWERDLRALLPQFMSWEEVSKVLYPIFGLYNDASFNQKKNK